MSEINNLSKEALISVLEELTRLLSIEQRMAMAKLVEAAAKRENDCKTVPLSVRMPQEIVEEKLEQIEEWMKQIDEGALYLDEDGYEDYSYGSWDSDWIVEYYDNQGIGDKIMTMIRFVKACIDDRKYEEAHVICEWLWEMEIGTDSEYDGGSVDLETLVEHEIISADLTQLALQTLYVDYQVQRPDNRAQDIDLYFSMESFRKIHIEDMFYAGVDNLPDQEQFWNDWISLLKVKTGDAESRLLREAVLYCEGIGCDMVEKMNSISVVNGCYRSAILFKRKA